MKIEYITDRIFFKWPNAVYKFGTISALWGLGLIYGVMMIYNYDNHIYDKILAPDIRLIIGFVCVYYSMSNLYWETIAFKKEHHKST